VPQGLQDIPDMGFDERQSEGRRAVSSERTLQHWLWPPSLGAAAYVAALLREFLVVQAAPQFILSDHETCLQRLSIMFFSSKTL
jgi:hypothetical protein